MATKRPVSAQRIPNSGSTENSTTQAAATNAGLPSNVNLQNATPEPTNAAIEGGLDKPTTEETIAESTTPKQDLGRTTPDVRDPEGGPTPVDTSLPGRPSFNLTDDPKGAGTEPGPDTSLPTREELKEVLVNEVGMHPVGAGEEGPPTDPQEARDFFAEHGKGSMISADDVPIEPLTPETEPNKINAEPIELMWGEYGTTTWDYPDGTTIVDFPHGGTFTMNPDGTSSYTSPDGEKKTTKQPDPDDEYVVPEEVKGAIDAELARLNELTGRELDPSSFHGASPNETQPTEDGDAFGAGDVKGGEDDVPVSIKDRLFGGDDLFGDATPTGGSAGEVHNENDWAINNGPDHADPQSSGPERDMFGNPTVESDWSDTNSDTDTTDDTGASLFAPPVADSHYDDIPEEVAYDPDS